MNDFIKITIYIILSTLFVFFIVFLIKIETYNSMVACEELFKDCFKNLTLPCGFC